MANRRNLYGSDAEDPYGDPSFDLPPAPIVSPGKAIAVDPGVPPPAAAPPPNPQANAHTRIDQELQSVHSTDDPSYWYGKIDADPNGQGSAWDYWKGRIDQGNGSELVKNGTLSLFNDGPASGGPSTTPPPALHFDAGPSRPQSMDEIMGELKKLFPDGAFNQDVVNRRTENASETIGRQLKSRNQTNRAALADRGLIGSGPEITAQNRAEQGSQDAFTNAVSGIYADESNNADQRMMQALQLATGLSGQDAQFALDAYNASTNRGLGQGNYGLGLGNLALGNKNADNSFTLGLGNLALGNLTAGNNYSLGLGQLGVDRDKMQIDANNTDTQNLIDAINYLIQTGKISAGGYIGK
jgi:hypothetical protein